MAEELYSKKGSKDQNRPVNSKESNKYAEVTLSLVLGIVNLVIGSWFILVGCNLAFPLSPNGFACQTSGSNLLFPAGLALILLGALAIHASIVVLRERKH